MTLDFLASKIIAQRVEAGNSHFGQALVDEWTADLLNHVAVCSGFSKADSA